MNSTRDCGKRHEDHKKRRHYEGEDETRSIRRDHSKRKKSHKSYKDRKEKRRPKRERRAEESSETEFDLLTSLEKEKVAVKALRQILLHQYSLRSDVRELAKYLDKGKGLDVSGIKDEFVRSKTIELFDNLVMQVRKRPDGTYVRRNDKPDTSVMSLVAPILEESPEYLERLRNSLKESPGDGAQSEKEEIKREASTHTSIQTDTEDEEDKKGPQNAYQQEEYGVSEKDTEATICGIGPELPSADQLRQAAEIMDNMEHGSKSVDKNDVDTFFIGPVPPEFEEEDLEASTDERLAEVGRIVNVLEEYERRKIKGMSGSPFLSPNPYKVLGIDQHSSATEIKKRYWKLSLLIHPDKCSHASAGIAFKALSSAASQLQDLSKRKEIDEQIERDEDMEIARELAKEQERAMAWSVAKGEAEKPSAKMNFPAEREAWMTALPQKKGASMPRVSTKSFSAARKTEQDSSWASIPGKPEAGPQMLPQNPEVYDKVTKDSDALPKAEKKSMLEKHLAGMGSKSKAPGVKRDSGVSNMNYRPFDREKDLEIKPKINQDPKAMLKHLKGLGSRFGAGSNHP
eukprot:jgi/Picsp_1/1217/NSC_04698-R1_dnaj heat shock n-terminal domain-containing